MRNVKKLLKKAMVFTLTAAMLVGTPLTASAAPLNSVFSIHDGTDTWEGHDSGSGTGTVTNTDTNSGALIDGNDAKIIGITLDAQTLNLEKGDVKPLKATVVLDGKITAEDDIYKDGVKLYTKGEDITDAVIAEMSKKIKWEVLYLDGNGNKDKTKGDPAAKVSLELPKDWKDNRSTVNLNAKQGTEKGKEVTVRATIDAAYSYQKNETGDQNTIAISWDDSRADIKYTAEAKVSVKEYSDELKFVGAPATTYVNHTLNLNDYLVRKPLTANDTITWTSSNTKIAKVSAEGVVTFVKANWNGEDYTTTKGVKDECQITAVGEKGAKDVYEVKAEKGTAASKVEIWPEADGDDVKAYKNGTKLTLDLGADTESLDVRVKMYAKVKGVIKSKANAKMAASSEEDFKTKSNGKYDTGTLDVMDGSTYYTVNSDGEPVSDTLDVTDNITWSTSKATIATVTGDNVDATIKAAGKALGTAKITAKASSGKSANVNAVVKASLNELWIDNAPDSLYSGQSVQLAAGRDPELNKDAVKWSIKKEHDDKKNREINNPNASISSKGVLTIKPKLDPTYSTVTVLLETKATMKNEDGLKVPVRTAEEVTIDIAQSSMDGFTITDDAGVVVAQFETTYKDESKTKVKTSKQTKKETTNISVPKGRTYTATVQDAVNQDYAGGAETLVWKSKSDKIAKVEANGDGTARITAVAAGTTEITVSGVRVENKDDGTIKSAKTISAKFKVAVKQPTTSITIKTPSVVVKEAASKDAKVTFKTTQNKGAKETITWSVQKNGVSATSAEATVNLNGSSGKVVLKKGKYQAGDVFTVTAASQSGVTATATIQVITASAGVRVVDENGALFEYDQKKSNGQKGKHVENATTLGLGDHVTLYPEVNVGKSKPKEQQNWIGAGTMDDNKQAAAVTYSVNKKGIVQIVGNTVYRVGNGTVKVTVKTADGKKYTLTIDDASKAYVE